MTRDPATPRRMPRRIRRALDQIEVDKQRTSVERDKLNLAVDQAVHAVTGIGNTTDTGDPAADEPRAIRGRGIVRTGALGAASLIAAVIILLQIPAYRTYLGQSATPLQWAPWLDLAVLAPLAIEMVAWVFTLMAVMAIANHRPSGSYTRWMWGCSGVAAFVNTTHNVRIGSPITGVVLGALSMAVPVIVHMSLKWDRDALDERTDKQRRAETRNRLARIALALVRTIRHLATRAAQVALHPYLSLRAVWVHTSLGYSYDAAREIALAKQYKAIRDCIRAEWSESINARVHAMYALDDRYGTETNSSESGRDSTGTGWDSTGTSPAPSGTDSETGPGVAVADRDPHRDRDRTGETSTGTDRDRDRDRRDSTETGDRDRDTIDQFRARLDTVRDPESFLRESAAPGSTRPTETSPHRDRDRSRGTGETPTGTETGSSETGRDSTGTGRAGPVVPSESHRDFTGTARTETGAGSASEDSPAGSDRDRGETRRSGTETGTGTSLGETGTGRDPAKRDRDRDRDSVSETGAETETAQPGQPEQFRSESLASSPTQTNQSRPERDRHTETETDSETGPTPSETDTALTTETDMTMSRKRQVICRYWELIRAGANPFDATLSDEARAIVPPVDRSYLRRIWRECDSGKHSDPFATSSR